MAHYYKPRADTIVYLNTNYNCTKITSGTKNTDFSWVLPDIIINDLAYLSVVKIIPVNHSTSTPYTFRLKSVEIDSKNFVSSDYADPILSVNIFDPAYSSTFEYGLTLPPQTLRNITINVSDSISNSNSGIGNTIQFIIVLKIREFDASITRIDNPYAEAQQQMKYIM